MVMKVKLSCGSIKITQNVNDISVISSENVDITQFSLEFSKMLGIYAGAWSCNAI